MTFPRLNVNIDHVATLRQARLSNDPDPVFAAYLCELAGANGIVAHLREDRRHIQDRDIRLLKQTVKTKFNLEMAPTDEMVNIALDIQPDIVTIVPEKSQELTTEGGYDLTNRTGYIADIVKSLNDKKIMTSLFVNPDIKQIELAKETGAAMVEIHTGTYSEFNNNLENQVKQLQKIVESVRSAWDLDLKVSAGHGLDYTNTSKIAQISGIEELNIGYSIISRAMIVGIEKAVKDMLNILMSIK